MSSTPWTPEDLGIPRRQNFLLWNDMELAYGHVENYARYSISGSIDGFLFELIRRRWNLACAGAYEPPPRQSERYTTRRGDMLSTMPSGLALVNVNKLPLTERFSDRFKLFAEGLTTPTGQDSSGKLYGYGTDGYATYVPLHLLWPDRKGCWGIYISESGVLNLAAGLYLHLGGQNKHLSPEDEAKRIGSLIQIAYQIVLRHQLFHFKVEQWALLFELATGRAYYLPYLQDVYLPTIYGEEDENLEETLSNLSILLSKKIQKIQKEAGLAGIENFIQGFLSQQGPSYRNYEFKRSLPPGLEGESPEMKYRKVVNYLCNQIIRHDLDPQNPIVPYYLYPPNNNFLRAENLCPIYLVRNLKYTAGVIS